MEHIAGHLKWKLTRHDVPFTPVEEAGMVDLENTMAVGVPYFQTQKTMTLAVQQNYFCKMIEPLFTMQSCTSASSGTWARRCSRFF